MMRKLFGILLSSLAIFTAAILAQPAAVLASNTTPTAPAPTGAKGEVCKQLKGLDPGSCASTSAGLFKTTIEPIIQTLILVIGGISVIVIVIGGLMYVLSAGDANNTKRAKDTIMYAAIGLLVALLAQAIVSFVIGAI